MMGNIYADIVLARKSNSRLLAVLIDPDKTTIEEVPSILNGLKRSSVTHVLVGGSDGKTDHFSALVSALRAQDYWPVILFPGDTNQLCDADAVLFLTLLSGRNPDYLIGKQVEAVTRLKNLDIEVIPTGYILVNGGRQTAVERVTGTRPISPNSIKTICDTALAGEFLGLKLIYLEAGSGADNPIPPAVVKAASSELQIPVIVGGGIRSAHAIDICFDAGATMVVIGNVFESDAQFFKSLK